MGRKEEENTKKKRRKGNIEEYEGFKTNLVPSNTPPNPRAAENQKLATALLENVRRLNSNDVKSTTGASEWSPDAQYRQINNINCTRGGRFGMNLDKHHLNTYLSENPGFVLLNLNTP